jgi:pSer/pThr/pTyr-binding forkhead associated (FHA) protein
MLAKLLEHGDVAAERREIAIVQEEFLIGRSVDCDLRLSGKAISRHHCMIRMQGADATLVDLGSANGTFVNSQRVRSQTTLKDGDELGVGNFTFTFAMSTGGGLQWGRDTSTDPLAVTCRIKDVKHGSPRAKGEGHPPGEATSQKEGSG